MIILPAIDIKDGECVRLRKGDFATVHRVADSAADTAASFVKAGARWLHMVDLDGAKTGISRNAEIVLALAKRGDCNIELGGGIRSLDTIEHYLTHGIARVILGSVAAKNPALVREAVDSFGGERIAVGIDAINGIVATHGWQQTSDIDYIELAKLMEQAGVKNIIFTDISRDGMQTGVNLEQLGYINKAVSCNIIASGGVRDIDDVTSCCRLGLYGMICGKAVYSGSIDLAKAIALAGSQTEDCPDAD